MSTFLSFFRRQDPPPTFTPAQILVTLDTTTHVDPAPPPRPAKKRLAAVLSPKRVSHASKRSPAPSRRPSTVASKRGSAAPSKRGSAAASKHSSLAKQFIYPDTPNAPLPHHTSFALASLRRDSPLASPRYRDDDCFSPSYLDFEMPPTPTSEATVYTVESPRTLARTLFFLGFLFPVFWVAGLAIILMPVHTTPDWEMGKTNDEIQWHASMERATELRWAKRCLMALVCESVLVVLVIVSIKWGLKARM